MTELITLLYLTSNWMLVSVVSSIMFIMFPEPQPHSPNFLLLQPFRFQRQWHIYTSILSYVGTWSHKILASMFEGMVRKLGRIAFNIYMYRIMNLPCHNSSFSITRHSTLQWSSSTSDWHASCPKVTTQAPMCSICRVQERQGKSRPPVATKICSSPIILWPSFFEDTWHRNVSVTKHITWRQMFIHSP